MISAFLKIPQKSEEIYSLKFAMKKVADIRKHIFHRRDQSWTETSLSNRIL